MHDCRRVRCSQPKRRCSMRSQFGVNLLKLTLVVAILGVIALVVLPELSSTDPTKLDLAAETIAEGMRYARTEATRRGQLMGVRQTNDPKRIRVFSLDTGTSPWAPVYDVYHPVSKKLWDIKLDEQPFAAIDTSTSNRIFRGTRNKPANVYFDMHGTAGSANPETVLVERYDVTLTLDNHTRTVSLDGVTGKVTIQ